MANNRLRPTVRHAALGLFLGEGLRLLAALGHQAAANGLPHGVLSCVQGAIMKQRWNLAHVMGLAVAVWCAALARICAALLLRTLRPISTARSCSTQWSKVDRNSSTSNVSLS